jgi:hypothetical protein
MSTFKTGLATNLFEIISLEEDEYQPLLNIITEMIFHNLIQFI